MWNRLRAPINQEEKGYQPSRKMGKEKGINRKDVWPLNMRKKMFNLTSDQGNGN